jgi:hypothetical protein
MQEVTGLYRKCLLRLLHASSLERQPRQKQRQSSYGREVEQIIVQVWESLDYICAERLTPILLSTATHLQRFGVLQVSSLLEEQLTTMSRATVARILRKHRSTNRRLSRKGPERANQLSRGVPMTRIPWNRLFARFSPACPFRSKSCIPITVQSSSMRIWYAFGKRKWSDYNFRAPVHITKMITASWNRKMIV